MTAPEAGRRGPTARSVAVQPADEGHDGQCKACHDDFHQLVQLLSAPCILRCSVVVKSRPVMRMVMMMVCRCHFFSV